MRGRWPSPREICNVDVRRCCSRRRPGGARGQRRSSPSGPASQGCAGSTCRATRLLNRARNSRSPYQPVLGFAVGLRVATTTSGWKPRRCPHRRDHLLVVQVAVAEADGVLRTAVGDDVVVFSHRPMRPAVFAVNFIARNAYPDTSYRSPCVAQSGHWRSRRAPVDLDSSAEG